MAKSLQVTLQRYERGIQGGQTAYEEGIRNPKRDWAGELTAAKNRMQTGFNTAMTDGTFDRGVANTGTQGWQQKAEAKAANYSQSAQRAVDAYRQQAGEMLAVVETAQARVDAMPRDTHQQRMSRMVANATIIKEEWQRRKG